MLLESVESNRRVMSTGLAKKKVTYSLSSLFPYIMLKSAVPLWKSFRLYGQKRKEIRRRHVRKILEYCLWLWRSKDEKLVSVQNALTSRSAARQAISERVVPWPDDPLLEVRIQIHFLEAPTSVIILRCMLGSATLVIAPSLCRTNSTLFHCLPKSMVSRKFLAIGFHEVLRLNKSMHVLSGQEKSGGALLARA